MTTTEKITAITETMFEDYILNCFSPDDFNDIPEELWSEILPEIEEHFTEKGLEFPFTEADVPVIKAVVDVLFVNKFYCEDEIDSIANTMEVYEVSMEAAVLAKAASRNRDTDCGYRLYYLLEKTVVENSMAKDILFDVAADFAWDDRLSEAVKALYKADEIEYYA